MSLYKYFGGEGKDEKKSYVRNRFDGTFLARNHMSVRCRVITFLILAVLFYFLFAGTIKAELPGGIFNSIREGEFFGLRGYGNNEGGGPSNTDGVASSSGDRVSGR